MSNKPITVINHGAGGIGDGLLGLCAVLGYCKEYPDEHVLYQVGTKAISFVELFKGPPLDVHSFDHVAGELPSDDLQINKDYHREMGTRACIPRITRYCRNLGVKTPILPELKNPKRVKRLGADYKGCIALAPCVSDSKYRSREYPRMSFIQVYGILRDLGYRVLVIDNDPRRLELFPETAERLTDCAPEKLAGVLLNCRGLIGVDSAPAHFSGILGVPTLVMGGVITPQKIFGFYPKVTWISGKLGCDGCWWNKPYTPLLCEAACASIAAVEPKEVVDTFRKFISDTTPKEKVIVSLHNNKSWKLILDSAKKQRADVFLGQIIPHKSDKFCIIPSLLKAMPGREVVAWVSPKRKKIPDISIDYMHDVLISRDESVIVLRNCDWVKNRLMLAWNLRKKWTSLRAALGKNKRIGTFKERKPCRKPQSTVRKHSRSVKVQS